MWRKLKHTQRERERERERDTSSAEKSESWGSDWPAIAVAVGSDGFRVCAKRKFMWWGLRV